VVDFQFEADRGRLIKPINSLARCAGILLVVTAGAADCEGGFPLAGSYIQNRPCKGDGSDPAELQVKISPREIVSKVSSCTFQKVRQHENIIEAQVECQFPTGPLVGNVFFTVRQDGTISFVDRDQNYRAILYRCSNRDAPNSG